MAARLVGIPTLCPGEPRQSGVQRDQQVQRLLLTDLADDDARRPHPQRLLDQSSQLDLAGALEVGLPALHRDDVRQWHLELEDLLRGHDPLARWDCGGEAVEQREIADQAYT